MGAEVAGGAAGVGCGAGAAFLRERRPIAVAAYMRVWRSLLALRFAACAGAFGCRRGRNTMRSRGGWKEARAAPPSEEVSDQDFAAGDGVTRQTLSRAAAT